MARKKSKNNKRQMTIEPAPDSLVTDEMKKSAGFKDGQQFFAKVIGFGGSKEILKLPDDSKQLEEDPFSDSSDYGFSIKKPPFPLEQLTLLAESHPVHSAALEQKTTDIVGDGPKIVPVIKGDDDADNEEEREAIRRWFYGLAVEETMLEQLTAVDGDHEVTGWGAFEIGRDVAGAVTHLYHVPGHTLRAHRSGKKFVQVRDGKRVWFQKWGTDGDSETGKIRASSGNPISNDTSEMLKWANEILIFRKPTRRSTKYGIPNYVSALGHITMSIAARDHNILFFENNREPRYLIMVAGMDAGAADRFTDQFAQSLRENHSDPHRNLILPIDGDAKITVVRMGAIQNDMQFGKLMEFLDDKILLAHRMPPDRVGLIRRGPLGGSATTAINRSYKDGVVDRAQAMFEDRLTRFIAEEYVRALGTAEASASPETVASAEGALVSTGAEGLEEFPYRVDLETLDITEERDDAEIAIDLVKINMISLNEGRVRIGLEKRDEFTDTAGADITLAEYLTSVSGEIPQDAASSALTAAFGYGPFQINASDREGRDLLASVRGQLERVEGFIEDFTGEANGSVEDLITS